MAEIIDPTATKSPKMVIAAQFRTKFGQLAQVPFSYQIGSIARAAEERRQCGMRGRKSDIADGQRLFKADGKRSEEHTSELQSLMRISYAVFCLTKKQVHISALLI